MRQATLLSIALATAFGQTPPVPYSISGDGTGPTFTNEHVMDSYRGSYSSIRKLDFRNLKLRVLDAAGNPDDHYSEELDSVHYLKGPSGGGSALALYSWTDGEGSSSQGGTAKVFNVAKSHLHAVQRIGWDTHFQAGQSAVSFDPVTNTLVFIRLTISRETRIAASPPWM